MDKIHDMNDSKSMQQSVPVPVSTTSVPYLNLFMFTSCTLLYLFHIRALCYGHPHAYLKQYIQMSLLPLTVL